MAQPPVDYNGLRRALTQKKKRLVVEAAAYKRVRVEGLGHDQPSLEQNLLVSSR
jgi:hypothetical protein